MPILRRIEKKGTQNEGFNLNANVLMVSARFSVYIMPSFLFSFIEYPFVIQQLSITYFLCPDDSVLKPKCDRVCFLS